MQLKTKKASVLVYSLIILSVMLMIATAFSTTSIINRKNASTTSKSSQSFQVADSGSNLMLKRLKDANPSDALSTLGCTGTGTVTLGAAQGLRSGSTAEVTFKDASDNPLGCSANVSDVDSIKSVGKFADTSRAIEVAVAAGTIPGITGGCTAHSGPPSNIMNNTEWGDGCKPENTIITGTFYEACSSAADTGYECGTAGFVTGVNNYFCVCTKAS